MKKTFFTKDPSFYRSFFKLMTVIALQNLVAYSVNMLDNIMLGSYSQNALSGAATVNQIYFIVNQIALAIGNALIAISSQYWGSHQTKPIRKVKRRIFRKKCFFHVVGSSVNCKSIEQLHYSFDWLIRR